MKSSLEKKKNLAGQTSQKHPEIYVYLSAFSTFYHLRYDLQGNGHPFLFTIFFKYRGTICDVQVGAGGPAAAWFWLKSLAEKNFFFPSGVMIFVSLAPKETFFFIL